MWHRERGHGSSAGAAPVVLLLPVGWGRALGLFRGLTRVYGKYEYFEKKQVILIC